MNNFKRLAAATSVAGLLALGLGSPAFASSPTDAGNGANTYGPYNPTVSVESPNGQVRNPQNNGQHKAVGRPDTGSVGKADAKNPKGQLPGPEVDGDKGYECDRNNGVGVGNPAHTSCYYPQES